MCMGKQSERGTRELCMELSMMMTSGTLNSGMTMSLCMNKVLLSNYNIMIISLKPKFNWE